MSRRDVHVAAVTASGGIWRSNRVMIAGVGPRLAAPLLVVLTSLACGGDPAGGPGDDGGPGPTDWLIAGEPPVAPPLLTPCPEGWREVASEDGTVCDPWPEGGHAACGPGEAHVPGTAGCTPLGDPCPVDGIPAGLPSDRVVVHVRAGATSGDGSRDRPFGSFATLSAPAAGSVVAIGPGTYSVALWLADGVTLWGACASGAELYSPIASEEQGVVTVGGADVEIRNLRFAPSERFAVLALGPGRSVRLEGVDIEGARPLAVTAVEGAEVSAERIRIRDTRPRLADGTFGRALLVQDGGRATLSASNLENNGDVSTACVGEGASLGLSGVAVVDDRAPDPGRHEGIGVSVGLGGSLEASATVVQGLHTDGIIVQSEGSAFDAEDLVVADTSSEEATGVDGYGLHIAGGASANVRRGLFERNSALAITAWGAGTTLDVSDVIVRDTRPQVSNGRGGRALNVQESASASIARAAFLRNRETGVHIHGGGTTANLTDLLVQDMEGEVSAGGGGRGVGIESGPTVVGERLIVERVPEMGVFVYGTGTDASFVDVLVRDVRAQECPADGCPGGSGGHGLSSWRSGRLALRRFAVREAALCGLFVGANGQIDLADGYIGGCTIGACIQTADFDLARVSAAVTYGDNGTNLDTTELPVPAPTSPLGG